MERDLSENHIRDILSDDSSFDLFSFTSDKFVPPTTDSDESDSENFKRRKKPTGSHKYKKKLKFGTERKSNVKETEPANPQVSYELDEPVIGEQFLDPDPQMEHNEVEEPGHASHDNEF